MKLCPSVCLKALRIGFATLLIAISLWALLLPPSFPYSSHAVINARAIPIRSTDRGQIEFAEASRDRILETGESLATVSRDLEKVRRQLEAQKLEEQKLSGQIASLDQAIGQLEARQRGARDRLQREQLAMVEKLNGSRTLVEDRIRIFRAALKERADDEKRVLPLYQEGIVTAAQWSEVRQKRIEAERDLSTEETDLAELVDRIDAHESGLSLRANSTDASLTTIIETAGKEIGDLTIKRTELRTELEELRNQMALNQESNRADMKYDLTTPIAGPVWHRHVVNGEAVVEDQLVAEVVDPDSLFVEAYFRRDFLSRIAIGDHASVFVVGEPRFIEGKVADIRVQESGARQNRAVNVTEPDQYMITATIEIDRREADLEDIGRFVKVLVSSHGKTSWIERGQIWLSLVLRSHRDS